MSDRRESKSFTDACHELGAAYDELAIAMREGLTRVLVIVIRTVSRGLAWLGGHRENSNDK